MSSRRSLVTGLFVGGIVGALLTTLSQEENGASARGRHTRRPRFDPARQDPHPEAVPAMASQPATSPPPGEPFPKFPVVENTDAGGSCAIKPPAAGDGYCVHGSPSIIDANAINDGARPPDTDMCSWWGDISWHRGWIPDKRRGASEGLVPPRSLCNLPRLCINGIKEMCLGYQHRDVVGGGRIQYCPHHDGAHYLNHSVCPDELGCVKEWPAQCDAQPQFGGETPHGAGRTFVFTKLNVARPANIWHWMTTMLEVFGAIVQADPGLVDPETLEFRPTAGRVVYMFMGSRGWQDGASFENIALDYWRRMPKVDENLKVLQSFSACAAEYVEPKERQCFTNAIVGTSTEVMLQWEDQPSTPRMQRLALSFAKHLLRTLVRDVPAEPLESAPRGMPHPWNKLYDASRERPRMVVVTRGEPSDEKSADAKGKRQMTNMHLLLEAARAYGFDAEAYSPSEGTPLGEQAEKIAGADVLIGVHGAALGWGMLLPPHAVFIECRTTQDLTDRTFIYPNVGALRDLSFIEWHQTEPITPAKDQRLPLDTNFVVTTESAQYHVSVAMKRLVKKARWLVKKALWHER